MNNLLKKLFRLINVNDTQKNLLAFEFAIIITDVAKQENVEITPELVKRAELIIKEEFKTKTAIEIAAELNVLCLSVFETK